MRFRKPIGWEWIIVFAVAFLVGDLLSVLIPAYDTAIRSHR